tara:strand:- start:891 stop:1148 length:258 start_codon:yes stop_codon:yes gene_type:complete
MDKLEKKKKIAEKAVKLFHEQDLEKKVISLAEKAAKNGFYEESIGLLDNLIHVGSKNPKKIASLAVKYQKEAQKKEKNKVSNLSK